MEVPPDADSSSAPLLIRYCYVLPIKRKILLLDFHILVLMGDNNWNRKNLQSMRILTGTMRPVSTISEVPVTSGYKRYS